MNELWDCFHIVITDIHKINSCQRFNGKPLISFTIKEALKVKEIEKYIISTDSEEIKKIAIRNGAQVPFLRPKKLALDTTPDQPVLKHILLELQKKQTNQ